MSGDRSRRSEQHYSAGARLGTPPRYAQYDKYKASIGRMKKEDTSEAGSESSLLSRWTKIAGVIALYWVVSISMVFINKYLLSSPDLKLDAPFFITFSQCVVAVICLAGLGLFSLYYPDTINFPPAELNPAIAVKVLPLSLVFVGMIVFNTLTLKYLGIAFYNVGRSLTTVFNVIFSYTILRQVTSLRAIVCCFVIICGFLLGLKEENQALKKGEENQTVTSSLPPLGVISGIMASLCVALYAIFTKKMLKIVDDNIWRLQFYNNFNATLLIGVAVFFAEIPALMRFKFWWSPYFWALLLLAGVFGIAIGYVTSLQIQVTTPLTHNVSGTAKACAQTVLACLVYSESKPFWWWISNVMVLGGSSGYTYVRMAEMKEEREKTQNLRVIEEGEETEG